jgi:uracil-DNA glycosylase
MSRANRILVYGQAPSGTSDAKKPLSGRTGDHLAILSGVTSDELREIFVLRNVLSTYPGKNGQKGDAFPMDKAQRAAKEAKRDFKEGDRVVLLGRNVARAFAIPSNTLYLVWFPLGRAAGVMIPHPSHVNLYYNNWQNRLAVCQLLGRLVSEARKEA